MSVRHEVDYRLEYQSAVACSAQARKERDQLQDRINNTIRIHDTFEWNGFVFCSECSSEGNDSVGWVRVPYPCPTVQAVDPYQEGEMREGHETVQPE